MYRKIMDLIPRNIKGSLKNTIFSIRYNKILKELRKNKAIKSKIYIIGAPEHGNLGDHAIMEGELKFLNNHFPNKLIIEIPYNMVFFKLEELIDLIDQKDIICVTGGGYMGSLWPRSEEFVRRIISHFSDNKIIVFPQTAFYETDSLNATEYLESSVDIYNNHKDLTLAAREKNTFDLFEEYYSNSKNILTPDIGLYLNETDKMAKREGLLVCLRNDREKVTDTNTLMKLVKQQSKKYNLSMTYTDTVLDRPLLKKHREKHLQKKLNEFRTSKLVVTDRLHGMIFAVITSTPCIALDNKTGKVKGVYNWIKDQDYIILLNDVNHFEKEFKRLISLEDPMYNSGKVHRAFNPLLKSFSE